MKIIITTIAFLLGMLWFFPTLGICQMNDYFWVFSENNALDFRYDPPKLSYLPCYNPWQSECAVSIADDQGNPKFYLDPQFGDLIRDPKTDEVIDAYPTSKLRDALGNIISNGDSIKTNPSMAQALLLPYPGITEQYILIYHVEY